jgi:hypothetical protein
LLIFIPLILVGQALVVSSTSHRPSAISPLLIFIGGAALVCLSFPYSTAKMLGASRRQRRAWILAGAAIALAEVIGLVTLTVSDLASADLSVRREAGKLLGSLGGERARRAIEDANAVDAARRVQRVDQPLCVPSGEAPRPPQ